MLKNAFGVTPEHPVAVAVPVPKQSEPSPVPPVAENRSTWVVAVVAPNMLTPYVGHVENPNPE